MRRNKGRGKVAARKGKEAPKFYCETCGKEVPADVDTCPHCGMPFYAVKCPRCGHTAKAIHFVEGCPSCGYLAESQLQSSPGQVAPQDSLKGGGTRGAGPPSYQSRQKKSEGLPSWAFFLILLILGTLFAGLAAVYLNL